MKMKSRAFKKTIEVDGVKVLIREIIKQDEERIARFWIELKPDAPYFQTDEMIKVTGFAKSMMEGRKVKKAFCLVALEKNRIVGFCNDTPERKSLKKGVLKINLGMAILKKFRNKGLGFLMFKKVLEEAEKKNLPILAITDKRNIPMQKLAEKAGLKFEGIEGDSKVYSI
jgi:predicted acetyltransferase